MKAQEPQTIWFVLGAIFSALAAHLWRRFIGRMVTLKWEINCQKIGSTTADNFGSKIEIRYDDIAWENIYYVFVRVTNDSSVDLGAFDILFFFRNARGVLQSHASLSTSDKSLLNSTEYQKTLAAVMALKPDERLTNPSFLYVHRNREYAVPALNRGAAIAATFVVCPNDATEPNLSITTEHKGVKLKREPIGTKLFGVDTTRAAMYGVVVGSALVWVMPSLIASPNALAFSSFALGLGGSLVGAIVARTGRAVFRFLG